MSISSTGLYGSATIVNSDLFTDVETLKETVTTLNTTYLQTTEEHRTDISQNRFDISSNLSKINDISTNKIPNLILDISENTSAINDISTNKIPNLILDISENTSNINDISINKNFIQQLQTVDYRELLANAPAQWPTPLIQTGYNVMQFHSSPVGLFGLVRYPIPGRLRSALLFCLTRVSHVS